MISNLILFLINTLLSSTVDNEDTQLQELPTSILGCDKFNHNDYENFPSSTKTHNISDLLQVEEEQLVRLNTILRKLIIDIDGGRVLCSLCLIDVDKLVNEMIRRVPLISDYETKNLAEDLKDQPENDKKIERIMDGCDEFFRQINDLIQKIDQNEN